MVELITTPEETAAASYLDWDDEALGKFTKYVALMLDSRRKAEDSDLDGLQRVAVASCAMTLANAVSETNAGSLELNLSGLTRGEKQNGDWEIIVRRAALQNGER